MSNLSAKASSNFDKYLDAFIKDEVAYMLPASRLTDAQWGELNAELASRGVRLIPAEKNGKKFMQFAAAPRPQKIVEKFNDGAVRVERVGVNIGGNLKRYTGYEWTHKVTSGLGFEHYRLDIGDMDPQEVQRIKDELKKRAIYPSVQSTNKGLFLIYNIDAVRNSKPADYDDVVHIMLDGTYNKTGAVLTPALKKQILDMLYNSVPPAVSLNSPEMIAYTANMVDKYAALGALSRDGINRLVADFRNAVMAEFLNYPALTNKIFNWRSLTKAQKLELIKTMNYVMGSIRREHTGNTIINMGDDYYAGGGFNASGDNVFSYKTANLEDFDNVFGVMVHENFHGFQSAGTSSIVPEIGDFIHNEMQNGNHQDYINDIKEVESRYMQHAVSRDFHREFVAAYIAQQKINTGGRW